MGHHHNKKICSTLIIFMFIFLVFNPIISSNGTKIDNSRKILKPFVFKISADSAYDYGYKVGQKFRIFYIILDKISKYTDNNSDKENPSYYEFNLSQINCEFGKDEIRGLSDAINRGTEEILQKFNYLKSFFSNMCTVIASTGKATKNNETILSQTIDINFQTQNRINTLYSRLMTNFCFVVDIQGCYSYSFIGIPILLEFPMINEKGLCFSANGIRFTHNYTQNNSNLTGISTYMLERLTMRTCQNVEEVAELWNSTQRGLEPRDDTTRNWPHFWDGASPTWADKNKNILNIEQTPNHIIFVYRNSTETTNATEDILWHSNHHIWLDPNQTGSIRSEECPSSELRQLRAKELLIENYGQIDIDTHKMICRDHEKGFKPGEPDTGDICRHPDETSGAITAFSWILEPLKLTAHITHNTPCKARYIEYNLTSYLLD